MLCVLINVTQGAVKIFKDFSSLPMLHIKPTGFTLFDWLMITHYQQHSKLYLFLYRVQFANISYTSNHASITPTVHWTGRFYGLIPAVCSVHHRCRSLQSCWLYWRDCVDHLWEYQGQHNQWLGRLNWAGWSTGIQLQVVLSGINLLQLLPGCTHCSLFNLSLIPFPHCLPVQYT